MTAGAGGLRGSGRHDAAPERAICSGWLVLLVVGGARQAAVQAAFIASPSVLYKSPLNGAQIRLRVTGTYFLTLPSPQITLPFRTFLPS